MKTVLPGLFTVGIFLLPLVLAAAVALVWLHRERRRSRVPIEFKLLRAPGESLRRKIAVMDEDFPQWMLFWSAVALGLIWGGFQMGLLLFPKNPLAQLSVMLGVFLLCTAGMSWMLIQQIRKRKNHLLGYLGERAVGEHLNQLERAGFRIFHDLPAENRGKKFNLDHVAVGPTGLFAIETKTKRKGGARPGFKEHEVIFDGKKLIWPRGEDWRCIKQAADEALWLGDWIHSMTGQKIQVKAILALPGWYVTLKARGEVAIMNEKNLVSTISKHTAADPLSTEQIDLIARQLEARCRDVED